MNINRDMYVHVNICKIYACMRVYLYIHNKYTQNTHILCKQKLFGGGVINRLTALKIIILKHIM